MNYYKDKPNKILILMEHARRLYERNDDDEQENKAFAAGALWAFSCILNEEDECFPGEEIPLSFENLLEKITGSNYRQKFCEGCRAREDAKLTHAMLRSVVHRLTISGTRDQRE